MRKKSCDCVTTSLSKRRLLLLFDTLIKTSIILSYHHKAIKPLPLFYFHVVMKNVSEFFQASFGGVDNNALRAYVEHRNVTGAVGITSNAAVICGVNGFG